MSLEKHTLLTLSRKLSAEEGFWTSQAQELSKIPIWWPSGAQQLCIEGGGVVRSIRRKMSCPGRGEVVVESS